MARANPAGRVLSKLRARSLDELRVRGGQSLAILLERWGLADAGPGDPHPPLRNGAVGGEGGRAGPSAEDWLRHFRARATPRFFASFDDRAATLQALRTHVPHDEASTIRRADAILAGRFPLLGHDAVSFGDPIDWQLDPILGVRAPREHWSRIRYLDPRVAGDHKLVWELNRHQFLVTLGQAYWYSRDERYTDAFVRLTSGWMDENPPKRGINWASSLEVGFRAIAWLWALHFFRHSDRLTAPLFSRITATLDTHGRHLERYLSTYFSPNTHLTGEALALYYLGAVLPELSRAAVWLEQGRSILVEQVSRHVLSDGVYFERATWYHQYTLDFYLHTHILSGRIGQSLEEILSPPIQRLLDFIVYVARSDGRVPRIGDDDGGRLLFLDDRPPDDLRGTLGTGAVLFERGDYRARAGTPTAEMIWLLGPSAAARLGDVRPAAPATVSRGFSEGGVFVMRDRWDDRSLAMVIDCGPHGALSCGHSHADALSFELSIGPHPVLVDPGTFTYTRSTGERDHFRGTRSHNTAIVDGESSSVPAGPFSWSHVASCRLLSWMPDEDVDYFSGEHDGYLRLGDPTTHRREILFVKRGYWIIRDTFVCRGEHRIELGYQCAPGLLVRMKQNVFTVGRSEASLLSLQWWVEGGEGHTEEGWVSERYGRRERAPRCAVLVPARGPTSVLTALLPEASGVVVTRLRTNQGEALRVESGSSVDTILFDVDAATVVDGVAATAALAWVRRARADGQVRAFTVQGSTLTVDGVTLGPRNTTPEVQPSLVAPGDRSA